ncbi:MAG: flagellar biosynthesis protein FlhB [Alphaproteobacteria bacterium]|nr:MAG: flagellar biosynthesis protein FlhB [Alphaproteobacteria bacterium]
MAEESDDSDKTEEPSQRKLDEARQHGQVPQSREITHWFMIMAAGVTVLMFGPSFAHGLYTDLVGLWEHPQDLVFNQNNIGDLLTDLVLKVMFVMLLPLLLLVAAAFLGHVLQYGLLFAPDHIQPKLERISLMKGFERIFSMRSVVELVKGIVKIAIVGGVIYMIIRPMFDQAPSFITYDMPDLLKAVYQLTGKVLMVVVAVLTGIAVVDWLYQRLTFMQKMRMSKQELKDEYKQSEGDPMIKQRIRQIRADRARKRMMAAVPKSTVVVTNPTHYAVALLYEGEKMHAPRVVAKGVDTIALRIRAIAEENKVPIMENPPLARSLYASVDVDEDIPVEHYKAVAEVITFVMKFKKRK